MAKTVLLIDENQDHLDTLKLAVRQIDESFNCMSFVYPDEALKALIQNLLTVPDYIIIDFNLPREQAMDFLYALRKRDQFKNIQIILYSTSLPKEVDEALKEAGADFTFEKPTKISQYKSLLEKFIKQG